MRAGGDSPAALAALCEAYRSPLLNFLMREGRTERDAEDLLQGFLARLLDRAREVIGKASADRGSFRTFLLHVLRNYVCSEARRAGAAKRGGGVLHEPVGPTDAEDGGHDPRDSNPTPDKVYDRQWALVVLRNALRRLREEQPPERAAIHQALEPILQGDRDNAYKEIGQRLGMTDVALRAAVRRMRLRLRELIKEEIKETVISPGYWKSECSYLLACLEQG